MASALDREQLDRLVLEHLPAAHAFAHRLTGDVHDAEDVVQQALFRVASAAGSGRAGFRGESSFRTWLFQILVHTFRDHLEKRSRRRRDERLDEEVRDPRAGPGEAAEAGEMGRIVATAVSALPPRQREVFVLHFYERLETGEVAAVLEVSEQDVRTNLHLARRRLKAALGPYAERNAR